MAVRGPTTQFTGLAIDDLAGTWSGTLVNPRHDEQFRGLAVNPETDGTWTLQPNTVPTLEDWRLLLRRR